MGRVYVIANLTARETLRQPLLYIVLLITTALLFISPLFVLFSFEEEMRLRMVRDVGLAAITFAGIIIAILTAELVVTSEIERQTTLTLLSKPVSKLQFIIGKFLGIIIGIVFVMIFLGLIFSLVYWLNEGLPKLKDSYMAGEYLNNPSGVWQDTGKFLREEIVLLIKGVFACFLQIMVLTAAAIALAIFFPLAITGGGCITFFILGHMSTYIYSGLAQSNSVFLQIPGKIIYTLLPNLTNFNVASLVATQSPLSWGYLIWLTLYAVVYSGFILTITSIVFAKREIK